MWSSTCARSKTRNRSRSSDSKTTQRGSALLSPFGHQAENRYHMDIDTGYRRHLSRRVSRAAEQLDPTSQSRTSRRRVSLHRYQASLMLSAIPRPARPQQAHPRHHPEQRDLRHDSPVSETFEGQSVLEQNFEEKGFFSLSNGRIETNILSLLHEPETLLGVH